MPILRQLYRSSKCKEYKVLLDVLIYVTVHQLEVIFEFGRISLHWDEGLAKNESVNSVYLKILLLRKH